MRVLETEQSIPSSRTSVDKLDLGKTSAVVTVSSSMMAIGPKGRDGHSQTIVLTSRSQDTWIKVGSSWKLKSIKTLSDKMTIDGRIVS